MTLTTSSTKDTHLNEEGSIFLVSVADVALQGRVDDHERTSAKRAKDILTNTTIF